MNISGRTRIVGIIGFPVEHSLSPLMHNAAFRYLGMDWVYIAFPVSPGSVREAVDGIRALGIAGVNVTVPHKEAILPYLDSLSQEASLFGAVNTVKNEDGSLIGFNTDGDGFLMAMKEAGVDAKGIDVMLFGAGGAARAIAGALAMNGAGSIHIVNRTEEKAASLVQHLSAHFSGTRFYHHPFSLSGIEWLLPEMDLFINATSIGLSQEGRVPISFDRIRKDAIIADIVYKPSGTELLMTAKKHGFKTLSGERMLLYQGVLSFEIWTGRKAPVSVMEDAIKQNFFLNQFFS